MYSIVRIFANGSKQVLRSNVSFYDAKAHIVNRENHSASCILDVNKAFAEVVGAWYDAMVLTQPAEQ